MGALDRYIIRSTVFAFLASLLVVTGVVWVTQSLRELDLLTDKGQNLWTFFVVTALAAPSFALIVAPVALFGAVLWVLNRLNSDSELAALSAAGVTPLKLLKPFAIVTSFVALAVGALSISAIPASLRHVRDIVTQVRADVVVNVLREGTFTKLDDGLTVHVRSRDPGNVLVGILIDDNRSPDQDLVYTAERGQIATTAEGTYLILQRGALQRKERNSENASIVVFDSYAFDLSPLAEEKIVVAYRPRERFMSELWKPAADSEKQRGQVRSELHDRLANLFYPISFVMVAFAALGRARTNRQNRFTAIGIAIVAIVGIRLAALGLINLTATDPLAVPALYSLLAASIVVPFAIAIGGMPHLPARPRRAPA